MFITAQQDVWEILSQKTLFVRGLEVFCKTTIEINQFVDLIILNAIVWKEAQERKARRAKRFGLQPKKKHDGESEDQSDQDTDTKYV